MDVKNSAGTVIASVPNGTIDQTSTSVALVGPDATAYTELMAENFVHILENFANSIAPSHPVIGQLWFNTTLNQLQVYSNGIWTSLGGSSSGGSSGSSGSSSNTGFPSTGTNPTQGGLSATVHTYVIASGSSVLLMIAGGKIVAVMAAVFIPAANLPTTAIVNGTSFAFSTIFPNGLNPGMNMANDAQDFRLTGHVPNADQATYVGGIGAGLAATCYLNIQGSNVLFNISNGIVISAFTSVAITYTLLPVSLTLSGQVVQIRSYFQNGLGAGITVADGFTIFNYPTLSQMQGYIDGETAGRNQAIAAVYTWVDNQSQTSSSLNNLINLLETKTSTNTVSAAIDAVLATTGSDASVQTRLTNLETSTSTINNKLTTDESNISLLGTKNHAWFTQDSSANNGRAYVLMNSDVVSGPASIDFVSNSIQMFNPVNNGYMPLIGVANSRNNLIGDLYSTVGKMVWTNGTFMKVAGSGFGTSNQFIEWFGPNMAFNLCSESNGTMYLKTDGTAYFGGSLTTGTLNTKATSTDTSATASVETPIFASAGHTLRITLNYGASYSLSKSYAGTSAGLNSFNTDRNAVGAVSNDGGATYQVSGADTGPYSIDLYRSTGGSPYTKVATLTGTGSWSWNGTAPVTSTSAAGNSTASDNASGSLTYTDPDQNTNNRQYKAVMTARSAKFGVTIQSLTLNCVEQ